MMMVGRRQTWCWNCSWELYILIDRQEEESVRLSLAWNFEASKPTLSVTLPPIRSYLLTLLTLPKQFYSLTTKHSNLWAHVSHFHSNHILLLDPYRFIGVLQLTLHLVELQKFPKSFTISTLFTSPKSNVSSETQGYLLTITFCKSKSKKQITHFQHKMAQNIH